MSMSYSIPLFDLNFDEAEEKAILDTLRSKWISAGPKTLEFETKFSSMLNVRYAVALANCTAALHLAVQLTGIKEGDEVICPSLTFAATVNAVRYVNAVPVFADIKSYEDLTIDPDDIEKKISSKTKAVVVMHYGGFACDMGAITDIANRYNLKVIEDACHSPLSVYSPNYIIEKKGQSVAKDDDCISWEKGIKLGTIGDVGCFSFFANKNISTGEGGMLVTNNEEYYTKAKLLRSHGMTSPSYERAKGHSTNYDIIELGYNYRMDDLRASLGIVQLQKLEEDIKKRSILRKYYIEQLSVMDNIIIPFKDYSFYSSNYIFPILLRNSTSTKRNYIRNKLADHGIQTSVHYPAVHRFSIYNKYKVYLPKSEYASDNLITLPLYSSLEISQVQSIANVLSRFMNDL